MKQRLLPLLFLFSVIVLLAGCGGGAPAASWFGIAAQGDVVYLAANQQTFALNLESGAELWAFPPKPDQETGPFYATPLLLDDTIVLGSFDPQGRLYAISTTSGNPAWAVETDGKIVEGATRAGSDMVVGTDEGKIFLVEAETQTVHLLLDADAAIWSTPLVDELTGRLYVTSMDHYLYAIDLESGELLWRFKAGGAIAGTPALSDGALFFGGLNSRFYAIDAESGAELWHVQTDGWVWGGPQAQSDVVYFGDLSGKLYALSTADGSVRWTLEVDGGVRATPLLVNDRLYFGTREGKVYALQAEDGVQQWALPVTGSILSQPVLHQGYLLISPHNAKVQLIALDPESGAERWSYPPQEE